MLGNKDIFLVKQTDRKYIQQIYSSGLRNKKHKEVVKLYYHKQNTNELTYASAEHQWYRTLKRLDTSENCSVTSFLAGIWGPVNIGSG